MTEAELKAEATLFRKPTGTWYDDVNRVVYEWYTPTYTKSDGTLEIKITRVYDGGSSVKMILKSHEALALHRILTADIARKDFSPSIPQTPEFAREEQVRVDQGKQASEGPQYNSEDLIPCPKCGTLNSRNIRARCFKCDTDLPRVFYIPKDENKTS